jgi:hypothetical protein
VDMALVRLQPAAFARGGQVRPPPGGELGCYWRRKLGLGAFGLEATPIFFVWADRFFYLTKQSTGFFMYHSITTITSDWAFFFLANSSIQAWGSVGDLGAAEAGRALDLPGVVLVAPVWIWP